MDKEIVISIKTVLFTFLVLGATYVVIRLGPVLGMVIIALLIVIAVEPVVKGIMRTTFLNGPVPRNLAVILTYLFLVTLFLGVITSGLQPILEQIRRLIVVVTELFVQYNILENLQNLDFSIEALIPEIPATSGGVLSTITALFSNVAVVISIFVLAVYLSFDWENIKRMFVGLFPDKLSDVVHDTLEEIEESISHWVKGQLFLMLVVGLLSFAGLVVLKVDYALALALVSGTLEFIPMFGPFISAVIAGIIGFSISPAKGLAVVTWFIIVQQLENNLLVPKIMQKASGFSPIFILLAILVGGEFFGILGVVLAVPLSMIGMIILKRTLRTSF